SSRRRHTRSTRDWSSDVCSSDLGMAEPEAVAKALEEFGQPQEVRSELEATHGQRMMAVVLEKAMQWKERTMRAKWLWATWAYLRSEERRVGKGGRSWWARGEVQK